MKKIKLFIVSFVSLLCITILSLNIFATGNVTATLYQQERDISDIRYVTKIENVDEDDLISYDINIYLYNADGTEYAHNTKNYTDFYSIVNGVNTEAKDNTYYAVFTLKDIDEDTYAGKRLDASMTINLSSSNVSTNHKYWECGAMYAVSTVEYSGYEEGCFVSFESINEITDSSKYVSEIRKSTEQSFTTIDNELIRIDDSGILRVDAVGLSQGTYYIRVYTLINNVKCTTDELEVEVTAYDRSGYAHFNYTDGVGAYKDDGTLKDDAIVLYVTESNKNGTFTIDGENYTGIVKALGGIRYTTKPVVVRFIGTVGAATWTTGLTVAKYSTATTSTVEGVNGSYLALQNYTQAELISGKFNSLDTTTYSELLNLNSRIKYDSSKTEFDSSWNMCDIQAASNVTVEGIGEDAEIAQWGFNWKKCNSIEVRNLTFTDYPEDACAVEGTEAKYSESSTLASITDGNVWIHHNTFNIGKNTWDVCSEQDKHEGDGATDLKYEKNVTLAYNHYNGCHKTGLVGGSENNLTANVTFHHNFYDGCKARLPFARQANMHMYNNYYKGTGTYTTDKVMQIYAGGYAFIEACYFENDTNTVYELNAKNYGTPAVKSYNNIYDNCNNYSSATIVTDRTTTVTNGNLFGQNFDTDSTLFYYDSTNNVSDVTYLTDATQAKTDCQNLSGSLKSTRYTDTVNASASLSGNSNIEPDAGSGNNGGDEGSGGSVTEYISSGTITFAAGPTALLDGASTTLVTVSGNMNSDTTSKTYNNVTYSTALKIESATSISFKVKSGAKLTLVVDVTATTNYIYLDSEKTKKYYVDSNGIITIDSFSGEVTILKGSKMILYAIIVE